MFNNSDQNFLNKDQFSNEKKINKYKFWKHKYDFAEINKTNFRLIFNYYFKLDVKKITILALLLAIEFLVTVLSKFVMGLFPIEGFYVIEISFFPIFIIYLITNTFYTSLILLISIWFRLSLTSEPIGLISMTITDLTFIYVFATIFFILKKFILFKYSKNKNLVYLILMSVSVVIGSTTSGFVSYISNYSFIFGLYGVPGNKFLLWVGFGITNAKFFINFLIFVLMFNSLKKVIEGSRV